MAINLHRAAHFSGPGLPERVDVWRVSLDDNASEVYFTQPYDRNSQGLILTTAMVETVIRDGDQLKSQFDFTTDPRPIPDIYQAMLAFAAMYFTDAEDEMWTISDAAEIEADRKVDHTLRMARIYRSHLPDPPEERS
jgi:hypothetical protein